MIISVAEAKKYLATTLDDSVLESKIQALELQVRGYTNNNFQKRGFRCSADIFDGVFVSETEIPFKVGDTVQVSASNLNEGLFTVMSVDEFTFTVDCDVANEGSVLVTKVEYPIDVRMGVINLLIWDIENRSKVGIASESISRHSVTYFNMDGNNSLMGFPRSLLGFLKPYMKARF